MPKLETVIVLPLACWYKVVHIKWPRRIVLVVYREEHIDGQARNLQRRLGLLLLGCGRGWQHWVLMLRMSERGLLIQMRGFWYLEFHGKAQLLERTMIEDLAFLLVGRILVRTTQQGHMCLPIFCS